MVKTIEYAQAKWERKTAGKGAKWSDRAKAATSRACSQMAAFVGKPVPEWCSAQSAGVSAVSPADFEAAIRGKGPKWGEAMRAIR